MIETHNEYLYFSRQVCGRKNYNNKFIKQYDKNINVIVDNETKENILELLKYPCD